MGSKTTVYLIEVSEGNAQVADMGEKSGWEKVFQNTLEDLSAILTRNAGYTRQDQEDGSVLLTSPDGTWTEWHIVTLETTVPDPTPAKKTVRVRKPQPKVQDGETASVCWKCDGTGFYCMGTLDGKPYSRTGFTCYPCGGTGWIVRTKRAKK